MLSKLGQGLVYAAVLAYKYNALKAHFSGEAKKLGFIPRAPAASATLKSYLVPVCIHLVPGTRYRYIPGTW